MSHFGSEQTQSPSPILKRRDILERKGACALKDRQAHDRNCADRSLSLLLQIKFNRVTATEMDLQRLPIDLDQEVSNE